MCGVCSKAVINGAKKTFALFSGSLHSSLFHFSASPLLSSHGSRRSRRELLLPPAAFTFNRRPLLFYTLMHRILGNNLIQNKFCHSKKSFTGEILSISCKKSYKVLIV